MKLATNLDNAPTLNNVSENIDCRIKAGAKIFNMLSTLYSNKARAVIRELSCNALDSHIGAGKGQDEPFDVHLPNSLEPFFSVKDYGLGLSHDEIVNIYTTYGESTKDQSNDFIGALGIGSKSPFCYTDNFTIISVKNGIKNVYTAYKDDMGCPQFGRMSDPMETLEPNGVEVKFAVSKHDFNTFKQEAIEVFKWFPIIPNVIGCDSEDFDETIKNAQPDFLIENLIDGVHVRKDITWGCKPIAIMGNIAYPIEIPDTVEVPEKTKALLEDLRGLIIHFDLGELDFLPSRETLSYIPMTVDSISKKLEIVGKALVKRIQKEISVAETDLKKVEVARTLSNNSTFRTVIMDMVKQGKIPLLNESNVTRYGINFDIALKSEDLDYLDIKQRRLSLSTQRTGKVVLTENKDRLITRTKDSNGDDIEWTKVFTNSYYGNLGTCLVIHNDTGKRIHKESVKAYMIDKDIKSCIFIDCEEECFDWFLESTGNPEFVKMSDIPLVKKVRNKVAKEAVTELLLFGGSQYGSRWYDCSNKEITEAMNNTDTKYYVLLSNKSIMHKGEKLLAEDCEDMCQVLRKTILKEGEGTVKKLYGVRKIAQEAIEADKNWKYAPDTLGNYLKSARKEVIKCHNHGDMSNFTKSLIKDTKVQEGLKGTALLKLIKKAIKAMQEITECPFSVYAFNNAVQYSSLDEEKYKIDDSSLDIGNGACTIVEQSLKTNFPMIEVAQGNMYRFSMTDNQIKSMTDYIKLVEASNK